MTIVSFLGPWNPYWLLPWGDAVDVALFLNISLLRIEERSEGFSVEKRRGRSLRESWKRRRPNA
jgi:hypothetical protein